MCSIKRNILSIYFLNIPYIDFMFYFGISVFRLDAHSSSSRCHEVSGVENFHLWIC